eukprot:4474053-Pyramimonas_sp.AAC.1
MHAVKHRGGLEKHVGRLFYVAQSIRKGDVYKEGVSAKSFEGDMWGELEAIWTRLALQAGFFSWRQVSAEEWTLTLA